MSGRNITEEQTSVIKTACLSRKDQHERGQKTLPFGHNCAGSGKFSKDMKSEEVMTEDFVSSDEFIQQSVGSFEHADGLCTITYPDVKPLGVRDSLAFKDERIFDKSESLEIAGGEVVANSSTVGSNSHHPVKTEFVTPFESDMKFFKPEQEVDTCVSEKWQSVDNKPESLTDIPKAFQLKFDDEQNIAHLSIKKEPRLDLENNGCVLPEALEQRLIQSATGSLTSHISSSVQNIHKCGFCDKAFRHKYSLLVHEKVHADEMPYQCTICRKGFHSEFHLQAHSAEMHSRKCDKRFSTLIACNLHCQSHPQEKVHVCFTCNKSFTTAGGLRNHKPVHSDARPYKCETCGKRFKAKRYLKFHTLSHKELWKYKCNLCDKMYKDGSTSAWKLHRRLHKQREIPLKCTTCGREFLAAAAFVNHSRGCRGGRLSCSICGRKNFNKLSLVKHYKIHSRNKPFECHFCGKRFHKKYGRDVHCGTLAGKPCKCKVYNAFKTKQTEHEKTHARSTAEMPK